MSSRSANDARARVFVEQHTSFVSRALWSLGVPRAALDDAAQQVFLVALRRMDELEDERAFLYEVAVRTAKATRRAEQRSEPVEQPDAADQLAALTPGPDELVSQKQLRELLDQLLERMPEELRGVFVLYEIEAMTMREIAEVTGLASGTVASRLRRSRQWFESAVHRVQLQRAQRTGGEHV